MENGRGWWFLQTHFLLSHPHHSSWLYICFPLCHVCLILRTALTEGAGLLCFGAWPSAWIGIDQIKGLYHQTGKWHTMPLSKARTMDKSFQMSAFVFWAVSWLCFEDSSKNRHKGILNSKGDAVPYNILLRAYFLIFPPELGEVRQVPTNIMHLLRSVRPS